MRGRAVIGSIGKALIGLCFGVLLLGYSAAQAQEYSEDFVSGASYGTGTQQNSNWSSFKASLPTSGLTSIRINGSRDMTGFSCLSPALAQTIANNLRNNTIATVFCDGRNWNTGTCGTGLELSVGAATGVCTCNNGNYTIRPQIATGSNPNWGGIAGNTCSGPTQTMTVGFNTLSVDRDF